MTAKVEATEFSVVVWCPECPWWTAGAASEGGGHTIAEEHDDANHPGERGAEINRHKFEKKRLRLSA